MRAFVDPYSSSTSIPGKHLGDTLAGFASRKVPLGQLPVFLHEVTHHWCFNSTVGISVALLSIRLRIEAARLSDGDLSVDCDRLFCDLFKLRSVIDMMRPIAEGIALFAEHDVHSGSSEAFTLPAMLSAMFFSGHHDSEDCFKGLNEVLASHRVSKEHVERKANLLAEPLLDSQCYLLGYLMFKRLRSESLAVTKRFLDPDLFLNYCRHWFFSDMGLARLVLMPDEDWIATVRTLAIYLADRVSNFLPALTEERVADFERHQSSVKPDELELSSPDLVVKIPVHKSGCEELDAEVLELLKANFKQLVALSGEHDTLEASVRFQAFRAFVGRSEVHIGHANVSAELKLDRLKLKGSTGKLLCALPVEGAFVEWGVARASDLKRVTAEVVVTTEPQSVLLIVANSSGKVFFRKQVFGRYDELAMELCQSLADRLSLGVMLDQFIDRLVDEDPFARKAAIEIRAMKDELHRDLLAIPFVDHSPEVLLALSSGVLKEGFDSLLDYKVERLRQLAELTLYFSSRSLCCETLLGLAHQFNTEFLRKLDWQPFTLDATDSGQVSSLI